MVQNRELCSRIVLVSLQTRRDCDLLEAFWPRDLSLSVRPKACYAMTP